ncbi:MAG: ATP-binding cassette domain-containing protein [Candidatus Micrarchaeota archaeon]|nr:ATP-binding cassette domain-containing protein [Candidatus Micrarchaeota archaeon]MDE1834760.1 ATP-binding cassette domain-containing protein [Candidatus Micrarchaeota archaeon]MDE1859757.1 ATP-binding cassette domain-containing protein [Candidatus Micrarchaeota archaeon]
MDAVSARGLVKDYGKFRAVNGISFVVKKGEIFGLLGPNGAGKTTTIKMLTTLLQPTSGNATVAGFDIRKQQNEVRKSIGIVFQDPSLDDDLTGRENLEFHAILYKIDKETRNKKIAEVLKLVELDDKADVLVRNYSGGMKRRLEIGRGLIHEPHILFLDEPTIGLDPQTRRHIWDYIRKLNTVGNTTLILTTHYIEEADYLCNRVAFVDHGKIVALDTPKALKNKLGGDVISVKISKGIETVERYLKGVRWIKTLSKHEDFLDLTVEEGEKRIPEIIMLSEKHGATIESVSLHKPSLEDVFIHYTGKTIREEAASALDTMRAMRNRWNRR